MTDVQIQTCTTIARLISRRFTRTYRWVQTGELEQEAWVAMLEALPTFNPDAGTLDGYLYRVALRAAKHLVWRLSAAANVPRSSATAARVAANRAVADSEERLVVVAAESGTAEEVLEQAEAAQRTAQVVAEYLAEGREGEIVRAVVVGELSNSEGAALLGIKANALYQRTFYLRRKLAADVRLQEVR